MKICPFQRDSELDTVYCSVSCALWEVEEWQAGRCALISISKHLGALADTTERIADDR